MRRRRTTATIGAATGAVLVCLTLAACGEGGDDATPQSASTIGSGAPTGTLTIWAQADEGAALPAFAKEFESLNPGVKVNVTAIPWDAAHNKYQTAIAGGSTPDVAQMGTTWMADFADAFSPTPKEFDPKQFFAGSQKSTEVGGTSFGVPWYVDTRMIYYRKDMLAKAGYSSFPETWDEFKTMAKAMQTKAGAKWGIGLPASGADSFQSMMFVPWSNGAKLTDADQKAWTLNTPPMIEAMKWYQSFFKEGISDPNPDTGAGAAESAFVKGTTPMLIAGPSGIGSISKAGGGDAYKDKFGVARAPKKVSSTSFVGGSHLVVFKKSANQDTAWKFIQWMSKPEVQVKWQKAVGDLPAVQSAWQDPSLAKDPLLSVFGEQLKSTDSPPAIRSWTQVSSEADKTLEQIVRSGADPAQAMQQLQTKADSIGTGD